MKPNLGQLLNSDQSQKVVEYFNDWIKDILLRAIENQEECYEDLIEYKETHPDCKDTVHWDPAWPDNGFPADTLSAWYNDLSHENIKRMVNDYNWDDNLSLYHVCSYFLDAVFEKYYKDKVMTLEEIENN